MTQTETRPRSLLSDFSAVIAPVRVAAPRFAPPRLATAAYRRAVIEALRHRQFGIAGALVNTRHGCPGYFRFAVNGGVPEHRTVIHIEFRRKHCILELNQHLSAARLDFVSGRLVALLTLLAACRDVPHGKIALNIDDYSVVPGLAFSDGRADRWLIPDPVYLAEQGYRRTGLHYLNNDIPWAERRKIAFWRGSTTGGEIDCDAWWKMDRVRLCRIAAEHPTMFDAGLAGIVQVTESEAAEIHASGLVRDFVPETEFIRFRYQIDIDGNSNSWPGLFQKLLTGSPVLKVTSRLGFKQWYYDRLVPWGNFVPVQTDMSDLVEKVTWLHEHDAEAQRIGAAGRALALSMTVPAELQRARATLQAALTAGA